MVPRGKLDVTFSDIFAGIRYSIAAFLFPAPKEQTVSTGNKEHALEKTNRVTCLSVRTGFDLLLTALNFPPGTTVLVAEINIPDMFQIMAAHQLVAVPLAIDKDTLGISAAQVAAAITPSTRAILITHLFGGVMDTSAVVEVAKKHQLTVIEDCAQAYQGDSYTGHPQSDVILYSFGLIKTHTTLTGAVIQLNHPDHYQKVSALNLLLPEQKNKIYLKKLLKVLMMNFLTKRRVYTLFYKVIQRSGKDFDQVLSGFTRGFPGNDPLKKIRYRPCPANKRMMERKLSHFPPSTVAKRQELAADVLKNIPIGLQIGACNKGHTYWVMPIACRNPAALIHFLRAAGYDATSKASSLVRLPNEKTPPSAKDLCLEELVYLPMYIPMKIRERLQLGLLIKAYFSKYPQQVP